MLIFFLSAGNWPEGSVMKSLLETSIEVVWFSDRHPNDIIYCICVNRQTNTVTVLFRAREGFFSTVNNSSMTDYQNPISHEDYPGNAESIKLRSKVADELLRARRDTKKSVVDEIREKVEKIGYELDPTGNWHATVAGHGLAGGMATVLGYFLASDSSFVAASAVRVFSFAASPVGCKDFQSSFRHLEKTGRILLARFTNSHDLSFFPSWALDENWKFNCWYKDVGIHIRLHKSNYAGRERTKQALDVTYSTDMKDIGALTECINLTLNFISSFKSLVRGGWSKNARISEYQSRMHFAREYRLALGGGVFRFDMKRKNLKTLNDYYLMKCRRTDNFAGFKKQKDAMPLMLVFFVVSCLIAFEVALLLRFVSGW